MVHPLVTVGAVTGDGVTVDARCGAVVAEGAGIGAVTPPCIDGEDPLGKGKAPVVVDGSPVTVHGDWLTVTRRRRPARRMDAPPARGPGGAAGVLPGKQPVLVSGKMGQGTPSAAEVGSPVFDSAKRRRLPESLLSAPLEVTSSHARPSSSSRPPHARRNTRKNVPPLLSVPAAERVVGVPFSFTAGVESLAGCCGPPLVASEEEIMTTDCDALMVEKDLIVRHGEPPDIVA